MSTNEMLADVANSIRDSFFEGFNSYETACVSYNTVETAWKESEAKTTYDKILGTARSGNSLRDC
jgi:hypothetical protein